MIRRMVYFRKEHVVECWQFDIAWVSVASDAFDDLPHNLYEYFAWDSRPENWMGNDRKDPSPHIRAQRG